MGEAKPTARVVTIVVFITKGYKFGTAQGSKYISILTWSYLNYCVINNNKVLLILVQ
jgi:hypothetical protein